MTAGFLDQEYQGPTNQRLDDNALDILFESARTANEFLPHSIPMSLVRQAYDLARMGPTSMNCQPMRLVMLATAAAKERLIPALHPGNVGKTRQAPLTMIVAYDIRFFERMPELFPHFLDAAAMFETNEELSEETAFRNATLQGAYLSLALRGLGLDVGPLSGFNRKQVDTEFFPEGRLYSNWLINVGVADRSKVFPRGPRLKFEDVAQVL